MDNDDDWLIDDSANDRHDLMVAKHDSARLEEHYTKAGYREGVVVGKAATMQAGFDIGFNSDKGGPLGARLGLVRGITAGILALATSTQYKKSLAIPSGTVEKTRTLVRDLGRFKQLHFDDPTLTIHNNSQQEKREMDQVQDILSQYSVSPSSSDCSRPSPESFEKCIQQLRYILSELNIDPNSLLDF